jgi:(heptosyl)LPS beta-1,4-glucosyltransferase
MALTAPVSIAIVAKNEEDRIGACLDTLGFADEVIVVVDTCSTDRTFTIAQTRGCRVFSRPWSGFADQKQAAVDLAKNDWVLILDADERVCEETAEKIIELLSQPDPDMAAYGVLRRNFLHGRWIRGCGWWPDRVVRLVNKKKGCFSDHHVHEHWMAHGPVSEPDLVIDHHSFRNYADMIDKLQDYSTLAALQLKMDGRRVKSWTPMLHGFWTFFQTYLLRLGIMEGFDGFVISLLHAGGSFFKYAKLRELWYSGDTHQKGEEK